LPRNAKLWAASTILPFVLLGVWENYNGKLLKDAAAMLEERPVRRGRRGRALHRRTRDQ